MEQQIPLNHEASAGDTNKQATSELPPEVVQCLENARFLHLATCTANQPHVSLMNYTYLPSSPYSAAPVIVMTTNPASKKMNNLVANPNVSLLVHDSRRMSADGPGSGASASPTRSHHHPAPVPPAPSSLAALLLNLNTSAVSSISATINGAARLLPLGSDEEAYYRRQHLDNNTFDSAADGGGFGDMFDRLGAAAAAAAAAADRNGAETGAGPESGTGARPEDDGRFVAGEEVRVVVVDIRDVRISDWKGHVRDWVLVPPETAPPQGVVNGVR